MDTFQTALTEFLEALGSPSHSFNDTLSFIDTWFQFSPTRFVFGELVSSSQQNQGSCKVLALAQRYRLTHQQALLCFGEHYRHLGESSADSHLNLRRLERMGLTDICFDHFPLSAKGSH